MTFPRTYDADFYPILASDTPLVVSVNRIPHSFPPHRHDVLEFSLVTEGRGMEKINGIPHPMEPGTATIIMPYQIHEIYNQSENPLVLYNCMFSIDLVMSAQSRSSQLVEALMSYKSSEPYSFRLPDNEYKRMKLLFQELLTEFQQDRPFRTSMLTVKLSEILVRLIRLMPDWLQEEEPETGQQSNRQGLAGQILFYLHTHYRDRLTLDAVADRFFISRSRLCTLLRESTGKSFTELIHEIRLRHACSLLSATDMKIADIATESGFASLQTFFRVFRLAKSMSPNEYRHRNL